jgi:hypothetical protein
VLMLLPTQANSWTLALRAAGAVCVQRVHWGAAAWHPPALHSLPRQPQGHRWVGGCVGQGRFDCFEGTQLSRTPADSAAAVDSPHQPTHHHQHLPHHHQTCAARSWAWRTATAVPR